MLSLDVIFLLVAVVINLVLGLSVFLRNPKANINRYFFAFSTSITAWAITNYLTDNAVSLSVNLLAAKLAFFTGLMAVFWMLLFVFSLVREKGKPLMTKTQVVLVSLAASIGSLTALTNGVVTSVEGTDYGVDLNVGTLYAVYLVCIIYLFVCTVVVLWRARKRVNGQKSKQITIIAIGGVITFVFAILTNAIIPLFVDNWQIAKGGPFLSVFIVSAISYSMAKHQLFDVRAALARSTAYVLSLGAMLVIYIVLIFGAAGLFLDDTTAIDSAQKIIYAVFAVLIAFTFQPLKNFFDKLTDRIFYREKYDPEVLLGDYTDFLVDETDTDEVVSVTLALMQEIANPATSLVVLYRSGVAVWYEQNGPVYGDERDELAKGLEYQSLSVYVVDSSLGRKDAFFENIEKHMINNNLKVSVKLSTHGQLEGFILLGDKKSGSRYNQKDLKLFTTIANELSVALQNSERFDQIERFNVTLQKEVDEATARLKQTNRKLQQLDTAKDEFVSMASHQLRTPLTSVKGYISMVIDGDAGKINSDQKKLLTEAFSSSQRMVYLIADLLNVSRLKTGKFIIDRAKVDLAKMVQEEVYQLAPSATTRKIKITYTPPKAFPELMLDKMKTRQVVMNFIDNAIYYTKAGGEVTISLITKKDKVEYRVKDTGIGIPAADQHKLFTKFFRAENARRARPDGTGLGLYMAQKIIAAQGGSIIFKSKEGKGSTFGFNIPIKTPEDS